MGLDVWGYRSLPRHLLVLGLLVSGVRRAVRLPESPCFSMLTERGLGPAPRRALLAGLSSSLVLSSSEEAHSEEPAAVRQVQGTDFVIDTTKLMAPTTISQIDGAIRRLQQDTGLKVRLICPPPGVSKDRDSYMAYLKPIAKKWDLDQTGIVVTAELRIQGKTRRQYGLLEYSPGYRLLEKFQFRLTGDYFIKSKNRFGSPAIVQQKGTDDAIRDAMQNLIACLYKLSQDRNTACPDPLEPQEVKAILQRHNL